MLDVPFFLYMKHEQEKEDIINELVEHARWGETDVAISSIDYFSDEEWEEIREEVEQRMMQFE